MRKKIIGPSLWNNQKVIISSVDFINLKISLPVTKIDDIPQDVLPVNDAL